MMQVEVSDQKLVNFQPKMEISACYTVMFENAINGVAFNQFIECGELYADRIWIDRA